MNRDESWPIGGRQTPQDEKQIKGERRYRPVWCRFDQAVRWFLLITFSLFFGHLVWGIASVPSAPNYPIGGAVTTLNGPDAQSKQLYLRLMVFLGERSRHAWLEVVSHDSLDVYVNGRMAGNLDLQGFPLGMMIDLAPNLRIGENVIAIVARQTSIGQPPAVAVKGAYLLSDGEHLLGPDNLWRCSSVMERRGSWWFEPDFDDRQWALPHRKPMHLEALLRTPPRATTVASSAKWIKYASPDERTIAVRREFTLDRSPAQGWLRLTANSCYRLAINGMVVDSQESGLGTPDPMTPSRRTYDLTQFLQRGKNVVAVLLTSSAGTPAVLADLEVEDTAGRRQEFGTDGEWLIQAGMPASWCDLDRDSSSTWHVCSVETGEMGIPPWRPVRAYTPLEFPFWKWIERELMQVAAVLAVGLATWILCRWVEYGLRRVAGEAIRAARWPVIYLALLPGTLLMAMVILATYDPRITPQYPYQTWWAMLVVLMVLGQWGGMLALHRWPWSRGRRPNLLTRERLPVLLMLLIVVAAFGLRLPNLRSESLQTDEIWQLMAVQGIWDRGFPSFHAPDLPINYITTSEVVYYAMAVVSLFTQDGFLVNRIPSLIFGTLTVPLLYLAGRRMFGRDVGLLAAAVAAVSPICIQMSDWGRYPSQLAFLTLLTVYFFWRCLEGDGRVNRRMLWLTALGCIAMFFTWEGSGFVTIGMAVASLWIRRKRLRTLVGDSSIWAAVLTVAIAVVIQYSFRTLQLSQRLWYGTGITEIQLTAMWNYPAFDPLYYLWETTWNEIAFIPAVLFLLGVAICIRHPFAQPARYLLTIVSTACAIMVLLLPLREERYIYHVVPLTILFGSAGAVAVFRALVRFATRPNSGKWMPAYASGIAAIIAVAILFQTSERIVRLDQMKMFATTNFGPTDIRFPDIDGACRYLSTVLQPGDVIMTDRPHMIDYLLTTQEGPRGGRHQTSNYYVQTTLFIQVALPDHGDVPVNYYRGIPVLTSQESLDDVLARHGRIWYIIWPDVSMAGNTRDVTKVIREQMEVKYEDFWAMVLQLSSNRRTAAQQHDDDIALRRAQAMFLR